MLQDMRQQTHDNYYNMLHIGTCGTDTCCIHGTCMRETQLHIACDDQITLDVIPGVLKKCLGGRGGLERMSGVDVLVYSFLA